MRLRTLVSVAILCAASAAAFAQQLNPAPNFQFAWEYGQWDIVSVSPQTYTWAGTAACQALKPGGQTFFVFAAGTPVFVRDALNPAHNEIVSVTAPVNTSSSCGFTGAFAYTHTSFQILSATGGLQESLNVLSGGSQSSPTGIVLNRNWYGLLTGLPGYTANTPGTILSTVAGNANAYIVDTTSAPWTYYTWNGSSYVSNGGSLPPTLALGAGAGTAPTKVAITGSGSQGTVSFVAGSAPTASATIFTLTWPTAAAGGFNHVPTCTVTSTGVNAYTTGSNALAYTPPARDTFTASGTALTAGTAYSFTYGPCL